MGCKVATQTTTKKEGQIEDDYQNNSPCQSKVKETRVPKIGKLNELVKKIDKRRKQSCSSDQIKKRESSSNSRTRNKRKQKIPIIQFSSLRIDPSNIDDGSLFRKRSILHIKNTFRVKTRENNLKSKSSHNRQSSLDHGSSHQSEEVVILVNDHEHCRKAVPPRALSKSYMMSKCSSYLPFRQFSEYEQAGLSKSKTRTGGTSIISIYQRSPPLEFDQSLMRKKLIDMLPKKSRGSGIFKSFAGNNRAGRFTPAPEKLTKKFITFTPPIELRIEE